MAEDKNKHREISVKDLPLILLGILVLAILVFGGFWFKIINPF